MQLFSTTICSVVAHSVFIWEPFPLITQPFPSSRRPSLYLGTLSTHHSSAPVNCIPEWAQNYIMAPRLLTHNTIGREMFESLSLITAYIGLVVRMNSTASITTVYYHCLATTSGACLLSPLISESPRRRLPLLPTTMSPLAPSCVKGEPPVCARNHYPKHSVCEGCNAICRCILTLRGARCSPW
jgi:hypothetical protein